MFTYQTRIASCDGTCRKGGDSLLSAYADLFGRIKRSLFSKYCSGEDIVSLKKRFLARYAIPARLFNSIRVSLEGNISSVRELQLLRLDSAKRRVSRAEQQIGKLLKDGETQQAHQKRRRQAKLRHRLDSINSDLADGKVRICIGSRKLWRNQYNLQANGYGSHDEGLQDWQAAHCDEFFLMGSKDEKSGCQLCVASVQDDGSLSLRLRLPDCLADEHGRYLHVIGVKFAHGHEHVLAALQSEEKTPISYRFKRDGNGWRVFVTVRVNSPAVVTDRKLGAIGVDLNADHLAVSETDASGNWLRSWRVPLATYGKSTGQTEALIGDALASVVAHARDVGKPVVIERLDFQRKKNTLEGESLGQSRMLSSFARGKVQTFFASRGFREGVEVCRVNPAFSSLIGRVKFMERYELSVHQAAALVLARRLLGCSERIPGRRVLPVGNGVCVTFHVPERKHVKHVWTYWGAISRQTRPVLAAQLRLGKRKRRPNPVQAVASAA